MDTAKKSDIPAIRQDLVQKAVKFLADNRVAKTPFDEKKIFLKNKGLTDDEINEAISVANRMQSCSRHDVTSLGHSAREIPAVPNSYGRWRDFTNIAVLAGGATYLTFSLIKNIIMPKWFGSVDVEEQKIQNIQDSVCDVQNGLKFLVDSVQQTLGAVQRQQDLSDKLLQQLSLKEDTNIRLERQITELKSDLSVIKGLFLSRDQFPSVPVNKPSLPAWQQLKNSHDRFEFGDNTTSNATIENITKKEAHQNGKTEDEDDDLNKSIPLNANERTTPV